MKIYISGAITNNPNCKEDFERAKNEMLVFEKDNQMSITDFI